MSNKDMFRAIIDRSITEVTIPSSITTIGSGAFGGCTQLTEITIPSEINTIQSLAFSDQTSTISFTSMVFKQPSGATVSLPSAGSTSGMVYSKVAKEVNIYTDNETIKNYAWATDNVTATFYHLDGSAWE